MSASADDWVISAAREALELPESGFVSPWEEHQIEAVAAALRAERKKVAARCAEMAMELSAERWKVFKTAPLSDPRRGDLFTQGCSDGAGEVANLIEREYPEAS